MENASEALKMGAGMIIAVLLIGLLVYLFTSISSLENSKYDKEVQQQNSEFNQRFLAFDRSSMYGTDVISAIGLAISTNKIYNQSLRANPLGNYEENADYSMNIEFSLKNPIKAKTTKEVYRMIDLDGDGILDKDYSAPGCQRETVISERTVLGVGTYNLIFPTIGSNSIYNKTGSEYEKYKAIEEIALHEDDTTDIQPKQRGTRLEITRIDKTGYAELKAIVFECTEVKYNEVGRIYYMKFEPK